MTTDRTDVDHLVVAVDGPSGTGKSSTARGVARALGLRYLDTGAMYRAMTWALLQRGVDVSDPSAVAAESPTVELGSGTDPDRPVITADGTDVSQPIRGPDVTQAVSAVSAVPEVRAQLLAMQRRLIGAGGIVVEGRDIGAVVAPDAAVKVFLTAATDARARRRSSQDGGVTANLGLTAADLARRDRLDSGRAASPFAQAADAVVLDTTDLTLDEAVEAVVVLARRALAPDRAGPVREPGGNEAH
ncbi:MAG: cytidylate kinase [Nocardioidaceae bacterium]|nr:cytidylate kinase [Nocardioidaceae bacterium]